MSDEILQPSDYPGAQQELEEMKEFEYREMEYLMGLEKEEQDLLVTRGSTHGEFTDNALFVQTVKKYMNTAPSYGKLEAYQAEALDMIVHKIARILYGDPKFIDSWKDISGYNQLVLDRLQVDPEATDVRNVKMQKLDGKWIDDASSL